MTPCVTSSSDDIVRSSSLQVKEREGSIATLRSEVDQLGQKTRGLKEEMAERDGQLRVAKMNLETVQKQNQHHMHEVRGYGRL